MTVFKKSISRILAIAIALSGIMATPTGATEEKTSKSNKSYFGEIVATTLGIAAITITSIILYNRDNTPTPDRNSGKAFNLQMNFLQELNSFSTQKAEDNAKYIKLSPQTFFMTLSCRRKLSPQNFLRALKPSVYIQLERADEFAESVHGKLCAIYMHLHNIETEQLMNYDNGTLFDFYDEIAKNGTWRSNTDLEIYMELCNFYCILKRGILELRNSKDNVNEISITSIGMGNRSRF